MDHNDTKSKYSEHLSPRFDQSHRSESEKGISRMSTNAFDLGPSWSSQLSVMLYKNYLFLVSINYEHCISHQLNRFEVGN